MSFDSVEAEMRLRDLLQVQLEPSRPLRQRSSDLELVGLALTDKAGMVSGPCIRWRWR